MTLRDFFLWHPSSSVRLTLFVANCALITFLAYLHVATGLDYEFYVFFSLPVAAAAWFAGLRAGYTLTIITVMLWFAADRFLDSHQSELFPMLFNTAGRLLVFGSSVWLLVQLRSVLDRERRLAREDPLTRLPNRREFHTLGRQALAQAQREGAPISAVFMDIDRFKEVNDELGHAAGDALLICVSEVLRERLRASDIAGRLGGDEFALLLPGMSGAPSKLFIEELQQRLLKSMSAHCWPATFSIGVASDNRASRDFKSLLAEADSLMYEVKHSGKNRILHRELAAHPAQ
jgi:diguanylate cyclase (GGDEF)-like protein